MIVSYTNPENSEKKTLISNGGNIMQSGACNMTLPTVIILSKKSLVIIYLFLVSESEVKFTVLDVFICLCSTNK